MSHSSPNPAESFLELDDFDSFSKGCDSDVLFVKESNGGVVDCDTGKTCSDAELEEAELVLIFTPDH